MNTSPDPRAILAFVRDAETTKGYLDYSTYSVIAPPKPMTQMTVGEVLDWQEKNRRAGAKSTAAGGYQVINKTLRAAVQQLGLSPDTPFNEATQDAIGLHLLKGRGYDRWASGQITDDQFIDNLAQEWAALPRATGPNRGKSHYQGDGLNASTRGLDQLRAALGMAVSGEYTPPTESGTSLARREVPEWSPTDNFTGHDTSDFRLPGATFQTRQQDTALREQMAEDRPGFFEGARAAVSQDWVGSWLVRQGGLSGFEPDAEFMRQGLAKERFDELVGDLPTHYQEALGGAVSDAHAVKIAENVRRSYENEQKLAAMGWTGFGLRLTAAMTDPAALALSAMTGGLAAPLVYGAKATRLTRALASGASAAAVNAGVEGYIASQDPSRGAGDVIVAAAAGALLGGAFGSIGRTPAEQAIKKAEEQAIRSIIKDIEELNAAPADGSLGAARVHPVEIFEELSPAEQASRLAEDSPRGALSRWRFDTTGRLMASENNIVRKLGSLMAEDAIGRADGGVSMFTATEKVNRELSTRMTRFYRTATPAFKDWLKRNNRHITDLSARTEFYNQVGRAVRRPLDADIDPSVASVASRLKQELADLRTFAQEHGVKGFDQIEENTNYLMRQHNLKALDDLVEKVGHGNVIQLYARSMVSGSRKHANLKGLGDEAVLDYEDALKIAAAYLKSIRNRRYGVKDHNLAFAGHDPDTLEAILKEAIGRIEVSAGKTVDLTDADVARIVKNLREDTRKDPDTKGRLGVAKFRMRLDEEYGHDMVLPDGTRVWVGIEDTLENNAEILFQQYSRQVIGAGAMNDVLREFRTVAPDGSEEVPTWDTLKTWIAKEQERHGRGTGGKHDRDMKRLEVLHNIITGRPTHEHTAFTEGLRMVRDYNFLRVAGQMGLASIPELGAAIAAGGVRNFLNHIPEFRRMWYNAKAGKFDSKLAQEIEEVFGHGTDPIRRSPGFITEDYTIHGSGALSDGMRKADYVLQQGKEVMSVVSGLDHINAGLQRISTRMAIQRLMDTAKRGKKGLTEKRLRHLGLDEDMSKRVLQQMREHVGEEQGIFGSRVNAINLENWADDQARAAFVNAVDRWGKQIALVQDPGTLPASMSSSPLVRTLFQFRSFVQSAYHKVLLHGIHHRDAMAATMFLYTTFFAGVGYIAQTHINLLGHPDRERLLEERLSPTAIGTAAFQRAGYSTFIPPLVDSIAAGIGEDPVFAYRTTELSSGIMGNPTIDLIDNAGTALSGLTSSVLRGDRDFTRGDFRALWSLIPFQNAMGFRHVNQIIADDLPYYSH